MKPTSNLTPPDSGRKCYRESGEPPDERPTLRLRPFWRSEEEASAYLTAARNTLRVVDAEAGTIENAVRYIGRIAKAAEGTYLAPPAKAFPRGPWLNREYTGPREPIREGNLTFEDRTDAIYERQPGEDG